MSPTADGPEVTVSQAGYQLTYYPGFCRKATVREGNAATQTLFEQTETYDLPDGQTMPDTAHHLRLVGGSRKQDVTLRIDDPKLRIARITVEFYGVDYDPDDSQEREVVETLTVENHPHLCPPDCGQPPPVET